MPKLSCPCGSEREYNNCCQPYIERLQTPEQPEALMRSRYTAYSQANISYIKDTMCGKAASHFNESESKVWAESVIWCGLKVLAADHVNETDDCGFVEFIASFKEGGKLTKIHERSEFARIEGRWFYVATHPPRLKEKSDKPARNSPCPCGSLKKYKNCHGK